MRKWNIWLSGILIVIAGVMLVGIVLYLEKKDTVQFEKEVAEAVIDRTEEMTDTESTENIVDETTEEDIQPETEIESETELPPEEVSLVFAGDVYLSGYVTNNYDADGIQGVLDEPLLSEMQDADICMVNEEFPFGTTGEKAPDKQFTFRLNPSYISVFEDMGVDIVSLANNHILDYGIEPLQETLQVLDENAILHAGAGLDLTEASALQTIEAGEDVYGFLSASRVIPVTEWDVRNGRPGVFTTYDETLLLEAIKEARDKVDFLTVYVHWGIERNTMPEDYQRQLAHAYIDAGADLVIGAHPHVLQGIESYNGKLIFYSLGNYIFNQSIEKTMLVKVSKQEEKIVYSIIPAYATDAKTQALDNEKDAFYSYIEELSFGVTIEDGKVCF